MTRPKWHITWPAAVLMMAIVAMPAAAQSRSTQPRVELSVNAGALTGLTKFTQSYDFIYNAETANLTVAHGVKSAFGFNAGVAVSIASQLWVGVSFALGQSKAGADITAVLPHPILFNAARRVQGSVSDVAHNEQDLHVELMYALAQARPVDIKIMGGPTFFNLKQDFVSDINVNETYPFDTATFASATTTRLSKSAVGFNVGVDIARSVAHNVAVGALIRYSRADVKFDDPAIRQQTVKAGGVEATGGVRIRF